MKLPPEQEGVRKRCFHRSGKFVEFPQADVEGSIPARFEKIVRQHGDRIAVKTETAVATYSQLNNMANRFARALLQRQGLKAQLVALLLEKDVAQIAAMLGAMKAGKFFLILDPSFPKTRLAAMLERSRAKLVVTNRRNAFLVDDITTPDCKWMRWESVDDCSISDDNPNVSLAPKALAFINYTSGSTGEPKGLLRTHRMILHNIMLRTNLIHVCEHDRISLLSSGTSNAITNSLLALLNGAGLYSLEVKREGVVQLARWLAEEKITIAPMSSPLFRGLCESLHGNNNFPDLRVIRLRSEAVYRTDVDLYKRYFSPDCIFVTGLSSNETGPLADYLINHDTVLSDSAVPVGYAAPGKELLLVNRDGERIGCDEVGEIAVRSRYLSPGYLRNPRLAKAKFKCDPTERGSCIYLTGDMGLMLPDGCLIYKGRKDFRVKVRGYPVDIKEVEIALRAHPSIRDSVIMARTKESGETALVAYFVTASEPVPNVSELVRFLGQTLPDYMIPGAFVRLSSLPLNPQNKVDRAGLPPPAETRPNLDTPFMAPRGEDEGEVAKIWAEVLGIDRVGIHDNFFELGGHSLAATRIVARVIEKFHLELPLQALFDAPTVEKMAAAIRKYQSVDHQPGERRSHPFHEALRADPVRPINFALFSKEDVERSVPERFEKMVRMFPDRIAVKTHKEVVTYAQLNAIANRMAHAIVERRGSEAEAIAILLEKGPQLMAAALAVLKAGKFFVLLDLSSPKARLAAVLEDSQAALIISNRYEYDALLDANVTMPSLLEFDAISTGCDEKNLGLGISPGSLAGVFYTSGSTGEPKGVVRAHRNVLHQAMLFAKAYKLSERDRLLLTTSGTANALTIGCLALLTGASLLPFDVQSHGVGMLIRWIAEEKITICWMGSPLFRNMCRAVTGQRVFSDVRILRLSSEASFKSDIELYKEHFSPECLLVNGLSNTEAGLICLYSVDFKTEIEDQDIPVGYPVQDKEVLLLDDSGKEVGFHEVGEIAIRSRYLSPGYWHRPELTAMKFKPDPDNREQRIYLSGDLGIRLPDGCLIHKGRKDFRVKIRGYGVEPAEVEKALASHASVGQVVVVARKTETGEARLVAYFTRTDLPAPTVSELRSFLRTRLPDFMIPSAFVVLETIPLTHSGKIDRRALPEPDNLRPDLAQAYLSPRNEIEQKLVSIWEDVLDVRPVGVHDGFFDLGGDSLSATRVIAHVVEHFQLEISLQSLFQSSMIADMAAVVAQRQGKSSKNGKAGHAAAASLVHAPGEDFLPLSYSQQRLWFLDQLDPGSFTYNLFSAYRLRGKLNVAALEQSFNEILRRHEVLRTVFKSKDGNPAQVVLPILRIKIPIFDLRTRASEEDRWTEARRIFAQEAQRPFDLATGPLLRITLLRLGDDEYVLLRTMHHIVSDGWSGGVLFHELSEIYAALSTGRPSPLGDLPTQYGDFAKWQRERFQGMQLESHVSYWKRQLDNITTLHLSIDRPRHASQAIRGARRYFALSDELSSRLKQLSRAQGATLFMTMLAAFQTLLQRYSNQTDIVVGSPVAGRTRKEFDGLIGFFLNMLVLRLDLSGDPTFSETITRTREVCLGALSHQELPFEKLVEEMHPDRILGNNPLFQVSFAFQNTPRVPPRLSGVTVEELEVDTGIARFDLHLFMEEIDGHLKGYWDYDTNLFSGDTIERMLGHFQNLLQGIVEDPNQRISELPLLSEVEKQQLLVQWNDTKTEYPDDNCIHELFETQVEKSPHSIAVVFEDQQLTYRELNRRANQLAHYLRRNGVQPNAFVALFMERSMEMVIGILGVLKAGGAYLPIDPDLPEERIQFLLQDARVRLLLTQNRLRTGLSDFAGGILCLDSDRSKLTAESQENPQPQAMGRHAAYVIYTSGSTGTPKGVVNIHDGLGNRIRWMQEAYRLTAADRVLQKTPYSFDVSVWEFLWPLSSGACLVLAQPGGQRDSAYLVQLIKSQQITTLHFVPSMLGAFLQEPGIEQCTSLRQVFCSGEALSYELQKCFFERSMAALHNLYGPTEASIDVTAWECRRDKAINGVPIGRPIANTQIYILGANLQPVPIGVSGELYIGGVGLARGYLNRPELTAEKFIADPFSDQPGARLYKTGDLARYLPDGNIEFLGRTDHQVKIRGFRIELGEIEAVLDQHPSVRESVVWTHEDTPRDPRLLAYVVPKPQTGNSAEDSSWAELQENRVSEWQTLFDQTFSEADEPNDPRTNTAGVNSSYTNAPIPAAESRDWVEHAARRILSLRPNRVLDIGCGLGRILFRVAPYCSRYWGADFSQVALDYVEEHLDVLGDKQPEIKLIRAKADELGEIPAGHFDTVVINGVSQYFPHIEHLVKVLDGAIRAVEPGGVIFVGDVRSLPLLEAFQLSVELFRAPDDMPAELLWQTVKRNVAQEEELLVDPDFFSAICQRLTKLDRAQVLIKRGWAENELTRFRYDAILYVRPQEQPCLATAWLDWSKEKLTLSSVRELLLSRKPRTLGIVGVPNARVLPEYRAAANLGCGGISDTARTLRHAIQLMRAEALHPEAFWALQDDLTYWVDITWSHKGGPECFDVLLQHRDPGFGRRPPASFQTEQSPVKRWHLYAHNPTETKRNRLLGSLLRSDLKKKLPDYMIPSAFVVLDALPLTPSGKIDRKALPVPARNGSEPKGTFAVPRTPVEELLTQIWSDVLRLDKVGIHDDFFEVGGHSLLATQIASRIRRTFSIDLPLRCLFEAPTVAEMAVIITESQAQQAKATELSEILHEVEARTEEEAQEILARQRKQ
jgi:amino acid adenylation domain-containing protein